MGRCMKGPDYIHDRRTGRWSWIDWTSKSLFFDSDLRHNRRRKVRLVGMFAVCLCLGPRWHPYARNAPFLCVIQSFHYTVVCWLMCVHGLDRVCLCVYCMCVFVCPLGVWHWPPCSKNADGQVKRSWPRLTHTSNYGIGEFPCLVHCHSCPIVDHI